MYTDHQETEVRRMGRMHHELPDAIDPYKMYDSEIIEEVLSPKDNSPSFPCETSTASRLRIWFLLFRGYFEGTLRALGFLYRQDQDFLKILSRLIRLNPGTMENGWVRRLVRIIVKKRSLETEPFCFFCP